jgi:hypothetical protein
MAFNDNLFGSANVAGRIGSNKSTGDTTALFLKKFGGEVMTVFDEKNIMKPLHTIQHSFPSLGLQMRGTTLRVRTS